MAHWYLADGTLISHVPNKSRPGEMREATLKDARPLGAYPSVTNILSLLAKPQLTDWMVEQGILTAWQLAPTDIKAVKQAAFQQVSDAAAFGTEVHRGISMGLAGETYWPTDLRVKLVLDGFWPWWMQQGFKQVRTELSFVNEQHGFAGTADILAEWNGRPLLADFKTQAGDSVSGLNFYEPDHPLQMAGYSLGHNLVGFEQRMSILISRTKPGLVACKVWQDNERYDAAFLSLLETWKLLKNYNPCLPANISPDLSQDARHGRPVLAIEPLADLPANVIRLARVETGESE